jgi:hypothetical protein
MSVLERSLASLAATWSWGTLTAPALTEGVIHYQDVRRALGWPRAVPPERLLVALPWALLSPDIGGLWCIRGLWLVATDLPSFAGAGLEVRGVAGVLLMAIVGRGDVANELTGQAGRGSQAASSAHDRRQPGERSRAESPRTELCNHAPPQRAGELATWVGERRGCLN